MRLRVRRSGHLCRFTARIANGIASKTRQPIQREKGNGINAARLSHGACVLCPVLSLDGIVSLKNWVQFISNIKMRHVENYLVQNELRIRKIKNLSPGN